MIYSGSSNVGIGISVSLYDNFTTNANRISVQMSKMTHQMTSSRRQLETFKHANLQAAQTLGAGVAIAGGLALRNIKGMVQQGIEFNYIMSAVESVTNGAAGNLKEMHDHALKLAGFTRFDPNEVAEGMKYLGMAGFNKDQVLGSIDAAANLAAAGDIHLGGIGGGADIMSNILQMFKLEAKDSGMVADLLASTANSSNTSLESLAESVKYAGGEITALNIPLHETLAMFGTVAGSGYKGSTAGTGILNFLTQLTKALGEFRSKKQSKVLSNWGLTPADILEMRNGVAYLKPMPDVIEKISSKISQGVKGATELDAMFMTRGGRGFAAVMTDPKIGMNVREFTESLQNATGAAKEASEVRLDNWGGDIEKLTSEWANFAVRVSEAIEPVLRPLTRGLTWIVSKMEEFAQTPFGKVFIVMGIALVAMVTVAASIAVILATIGLSLLGINVSAKAMGLSLTWAWNSAAAAALRYTGAATAATVATNAATAASYTGLGGQMAIPGIKGFVSAGAAGSIMGGITGMLSKLGSVLITLWGVIANIIAVFTAVLAIGLLIWGIYELFNDDVEERRAAMKKDEADNRKYKHLGMSAISGTNVYEGGQRIYHRDDTFRNEKNNELAAIEASKKNKYGFQGGSAISVNNNVYLDGKQVHKSVEEIESARIDKYLTDNINY